MNGTQIDFANIKGAAGQDLLFVSGDDQTKLSFDLEIFKATAPVSLSAWVLLPFVPAGDSSIFLYYNNVAAVAAQNKQAVRIPPC